MNSIIIFGIIIIICIIVYLCFDFTDKYINKISKEYDLENNKKSSKVNKKINV